MAVVTNPSIDAKTRAIIVHIVEKIKSEGVFDRFRRDCLEELDSKEPYRQLKQRVESHVATFLSKQVYSPSLPKNQLRNSLRANISQSEVLSKGVDRLLGEVLTERSGSFYGEIESLVHDYLSSIGHYSRIEREKQQKAEMSKLIDKEIDDFIKEETSKILEASAEEKLQEKSASTESLPNNEPLPNNKPLPNNEDTQMIVTESITTSNYDEARKTTESDSDATELTSKPDNEASSSAANIVEETDGNTESQQETIEEAEVGDKSDSPTSDEDKPVLPQDSNPEDEKQTEEKSEKKEEELPNAAPIPAAQLTSTDEETDENEDLGVAPVLSKTSFLESKAESIDPKGVNIALSDSDITVSSVHTSDLSSLEDSLSDLEFEEYKEMSKKFASKPVKTGESPTGTNEPFGNLSNSKKSKDDATSDADDEAALSDSDFGKPRSRNLKQFCPISSEQESEPSNEASASLNEEQKDPVPQRRSARVASKDRTKVEERDDEPQVPAKESDQPGKNNEESRKRVRQKRKEIMKEKKRELAGRGQKSEKELTERAHEHEQKMTSDSNESEDVRQSKRSRRTIRPTRCYSPSENN